MKKYKIEFVQKETFVVDVLAKNQKEAEKIATKYFNEGVYQEIGDCEVEINMVYDVSETDDPFFPENE